MEDRIGLFLGYLGTIIIPLIGLKLGWFGSLRI